MGGGERGDAPRVTRWARTPCPASVQERFPSTVKVGESFWTLGALKRKYAVGLVQHTAWFAAQRTGSCTSRCRKRTRARPGLARWWAMQRSVPAMAPRSGQRVILAARRFLGPDGRVGPDGGPQEDDAGAIPGGGAPPPRPSPPHRARQLRRPRWAARRTQGSIFRVQSSLALFRTPNPSWAASRTRGSAPPQPPPSPWQHLTPVEQLPNIPRLHDAHGRNHRRLCHVEEL